MVEIGAEPTPIAAALGRSLRQQLSVCGQGASVRLEVVWQTSLSGSVPALTPMFLVPPCPIDVKTDLDGSDPESFVRRVQDAVTRWRTDEDPVIAAGVAVVFRTTLYPVTGPEHEVVLRYAVAPDRPG